MTKVPLRAVNILRNDPDAHVCALPDLYPPNVVHPHASCDELKKTLVGAFKDECRRLKVDATPLLPRFHVYCLKHDLEALLLASETQLKRHLGFERFPRSIKWVKPVEDQDHHRPPKRVVEDLFAHAKRRYVDTVDAPLILGGADPSDLPQRCPQCFRPFLGDLSALARVGPLQ